MPKRRKINPALKRLLRFPDDSEAIKLLDMGLLRLKRMRVRGDVPQPIAPVRRDGTGRMVFAATMAAWLSRTARKVASASLKRRSSDGRNGGQSAGGRSPDEPLPSLLHDEAFKAAAREAGCNEDEAAFDCALKKVTPPPKSVKKRKASSKRRTRAPSQSSSE